MKIARRYRVLLVTLVTVFVLWLVYYAAVGVIFGIKLSNLEAQVEAEGSTLDIVELASRQEPPRVANHENAAFLYRAAGVLIHMRSTPDQPGWMAYSALEETKPGDRGKVVAQRRPDLETWLRDCALPLQLLHRAARIKHTRFQVDYSMGAKLELPHLAVLREAARLLSLEARLRALEGDAHQSLQAVWALLRLRHGTKSDPTMISQLVGVVTDSKGLSALEDSLPSLQPTEEDLRAILEELQSRDSEPFVLGAQGRRAITAMHMKSARENGPRHVLREEFLNFPAEHIPTALEDTLICLARGPLMDHVLGLSYGNWLVRSASNLDSLRNGEVRRLRDYTESLYRNRSFIWRHLHRLRILSTFELGRYLDRFKEALARYDVAVCGVATELYRLDHGAYPKSLDALSPKYLKTTPKDTYTGKPLRFEPLPNGVLIYSVGLNGKDDGGKAGKEEWLGFGLEPADDDDIAWRVERDGAPPKEDGR